jgi:hypothetical protein
MALNGGVSLAVWMGGSACELDCARRAHLAAEAMEGAPERRVYHGLCKAFRRVLIIDLMSGSSAGGINGALLGASIRHRRRLNPNFLRQQWLELGDFGSLLHRPSEPSPMSLMQGDAFFRSLEAAFKSLLNGEHGTELPKEQEALPELDVSLDVTTTNVAGEQRTFVDYWERPLVARQYRARFRFRRPVDYTPSLLAAASRASASFPGAFEPWRVEAPVGDLAGFSRSRWVLDGGLLDNAPIEAALELIPTRPFHRQVRRYICYMNAEPPTETEEALAADLNTPALAAVGGHVISLPRKAAFVDQLNTIERATRASTLGTGETPALDLLRLDLETLEETARALLPSYQTGRRLLSLEELFTEPARARQAHNQLGADGELPWIPSDLCARRSGSWQWGLRPAERVMQLCLDIVRRAAADKPPETRLRLFDAGKKVGQHLRGIEEVEACFARSDPGYGPVSAALERALGHIESFDPVPPLRQAAAELHEVRSDLAVGGAELAEHLFGPGWDEDELSDSSFEHFLRRALAIEVVRRSVAPDDEPFASGQDLRFAQLTPYAPALVFAEDPLRESTCWAAPEQKLTGLALGHFAAFYRGSWRVNDFMWGRLDAAVRVVDLLVAPGRARQVERDDAVHSVAETLTEELLKCEPAEDQRWLLAETLAAVEGREPIVEGEVPSAGDLHPRLLAALQKDLHGSGYAGIGELRRPGDLTRIVCVRAAQLEVLANELPPLNEASKNDVGFGAGAPELALPLNGSLRQAIEALRDGKPLPKRLTADDEIASELAIRTGTQAALVTLAMLRAARMPLARALFGVRAALLPVAGSVAKGWVTRLAVATAFYAATLFLAGRLLTTQKRGFEELTTIVLVAELVALFTVLVVLGTAFVPGFRAWFARSKARRVGQMLLGAGIILSGGLVALLLAGFAGGVTIDRLITAPHAERPPDPVLYLVVAFVVGGPLVLAPALVRGRLDRLLAKSWGGLPSLLLAFTIAGLVIGYSAGEILALLDGRWWQATIAVVALFVAPVVVLISLFWGSLTTVARRLRSTSASHR